MRKTPWPENFSLTANLRDYALSRGVANPDFEWEHFENHHRAKGSVFADWVRAWYTWVLRSHYYRPMGSAPPQNIEKLGVSPQDQLDLYRATGRWPQ